MKKWTMALLAAVFSVAAAQAAPAAPNERTPKLYITGNGPDGLSRVVEVRDVTPETAGPVHASKGPAPTLVTSKTRAYLLPPREPPGSFRSSVFVWRPGMYTDRHRTVSADMDVVLKGSVILELEKGAVTLHAGDAVYLPGTVHTWRATDEIGLVLYTVVSGAPTAADLAEPHVESAAIVHGAPKR